MNQDPQRSRQERDDQELRNQQSSSQAPASLSTDPKKKVPIKTPHVKPPFVNTSMNKFMTNLILAVIAVIAFYIWRISVWAGDAGGYWALITGNPNKAAAIEAKREAAMSASATSFSSIRAKETSKSGTQYTSVPSSNNGAGPIGDTDVQSTILHLASLLGCSPADLTSAIRPFIDPSVPNPVEEARRIREQVEAHKMAGAGAGAGAPGVAGVDEKEVAKQAEEAAGPGLLAFAAEALLD